MDKIEVIEKMMNSENGGLYAAIGGIVLCYGLDRVTKSRYKVDARKESFTLGPAAVLIYVIIHNHLLKSW